MQKELIRKNFIKGASTYNAHSPVQAQMALALAQDIQTHLKHPCLALEFGAGTGHLTQHLVQNSKIKQLDCVDLSLNSLLHNQRARLSEGALIKPHYIESDIEKYALPTCYGLFTANATLQWLQHPEALISQMLQNLNAQEGLLALGVFGNQNLKRFYETRSLAAGREIPLPVRYFSSMELKGFVSGTNAQILSLHSFTYMQKFESFWDLVRSFKQIGAQGDPTELTPAQMREWQRLYCPVSEEAVAEWEYFIVVIQAQK